jgi:hypothetical protein
MKKSIQEATAKHLSKLHTKRGRVGREKIKKNFAYQAWLGTC